MNQVNRRYFESLMRDQGLSLRGLAGRMGMSHSQLSLTFSGERKLQIEEAVQISSILGQPLMQVLEAAGAPVRQATDVRVPVVGAVQGDGTVLLTDESTAERTIAPEVVPSDSVAVQFRTAGSALEWMDGWVVFCRRPQQIDASIVGRFSYLKVKDGPHVMATARRGYRENTYNLRGPYTADSVNLEFGSPVLWSRN